MKRVITVNLSSKHNPVEDLEEKLELEYNADIVYKLKLSHTTIDATLARHLETALASPVERLDLSHTELKHEELKLLSESFNCLTHLNLSHNNLSWGDIGPIVELVCYSYDLTKLNLSCNDIGIPGLMAILGAMIVNPKLKSLRCADIDISNDYGRFLATHLATNTTLVSLDLSSNDLLQTNHNIRNMAHFINTNTTVSKLKLRDNIYYHCKRSRYKNPTINPFSDALMFNRTLMVLDLHACKFGPATITVLDALTANTNLTRLNLGNANLKDKHAFHVARLISCNTRLTHLDVSYNHFLNGVVPIFKALAFNTTLIRFKMSDTIQGESIIHSLLAVILRNTTLKKLYASSIANIFYINHIRVCLKHNTTLLSMGAIHNTNRLDPNIDKLLQRNRILAAQKNVSFTDLLVMAPPSQLLSKKESDSKKQRTL